MLDGGGAHGLDLSVEEQRTCRNRTVRRIASPFIELGAEPRTHELRRGSLVSRPAGTGICHWIEAGGEGITYLVYGTRAQNDVTYYPRKNGLWFKSAGVMIAADHISILGD